MPKISGLQDREILVAADDPNTPRAVAEVKTGIRDGNPLYANRTWYTTTGNDFEPDQPVEIEKE